MSTDTDVKMDTSTVSDESSSSPLSFSSGSAFLGVEGGTIFGSTDSSSGATIFRSQKEKEVTFQ